MPLSKEKYIGPNIVGKTIAGVFYSPGSMLLVFSDGTHTCLLYGDEEPVRFCSMILRQYKDHYDELLALGAIDEQELEFAREADRRLEERLNSAVQEIAQRNKDFETLEREDIANFPYEMFHPDAEGANPKFKTWIEAISTQKEWNKVCPGHVARKRKLIL